MGDHCLGSLKEMKWRNEKKEMRNVSSGACQRSQVQRVNDNKKVCKWACCCRGVIHNNERGAGGCGVESLMEMSGGWAAREEGTEETYFYVF